MSRMLTFHEAAWTSARDAASAGRRTHSLAFLAPLLTGATDVPDRLVLLAHRLAARIHYAAERYRKCRKHLLEAARLDPTNAEIHYELGLAFGNDPYGCDRRAACRFKKAVAFDPKQAKYAAAAGRALVRIDRVRSGVKLLRVAVRQAPSDSTILQVVVDGMCEAGRAKEAWTLATRAKFLAPADPSIDRSMDQVRFALARRSQDFSRKKPGGRPVVLPFLRVVGEVRTDVRDIFRRDTASRSGPHFRKLRAFRDKRG